jgi:hypothetical protein
LFVPVAALLAMGAVVSLAVARLSAPGAEPAPPAAPQPMVSVDAASAVDPARKDASATGEKDARAATNDGDGDDADIGDVGDIGTTGTVLMPPRAAGHRIFVDGRRAKSDGTAPLRLRCGPHVIQIGSSGAPENIDLPCRGEVQLQ